MFGRKKKQEKAEDAASPDYGVNVDDMSDDESSVPPPPPGTKSTEGFKDENSNNEDGNTYQDEEGGDKNISFLTDSTDGDDLKKEKEADPNKRKKCALIFLFIAMLAVLIGLTVKYATKAPKSSATSTGQGEDGFFDANGETVPTENGGDVGVVTANPVGDGTIAPTLAGTSTGTEFGTFPGPGEMDCAVDAIYASSTCSGGETSATITICFNGEIGDQFWQWISTPPDYEEFIENDWGWLADSMTIQRDSIPTGLYTIGLYANGDQDLDEFPLITSTEFQVLCS